MESRLQSKGCRFNSCPFHVLFCIYSRPQFFLFVRTLPPRGVFCDAAGKTPSIPAIRMQKWYRAGWNRHRMHYSFFQLPYVLLPKNIVDTGIIRQLFLLSKADMSEFSWLLQQEQVYLWFAGSLLLGNLTWYELTGAQDDTKRVTSKTRWGKDFATSKHGCLKIRI